MYYEWKEMKYVWIMEDIYMQYTCNTYVIYM